MKQVLTNAITLLLLFGTTISLAAPLLQLKPMARRQDVPASEPFPTIFDDGAISAEPPSVEIVEPILSQTILETIIALPEATAPVITARPTPEAPITSEGPRPTGEPGTPNTPILTF